VPQARSQALHSLSKIGDPRAWSAITRELLTEPHDDIARSAWRAAVVLVPEGGEGELATILGSQLGRGDRNVQLSLSRALAALGEAAASVLAAAAVHEDERVRTHALATQRIARDPDEGFEQAIFEAQRLVALQGAPMVDDEHVDR
jgi:HEAT repeat protein